MKRARKASRLQGNLLNGLLLLFVALLLVAAIFLVRTKLLQNAQDLGMALVHSYAVEEEMNISSLETSLNLTSHSIDEVLEQGGDSAAIQNWVKEYLTKITATIGEDLVDLYAVIDGEILAVNPWDRDATYPYQQTDWYQRAVQAEQPFAARHIWTPSPAKRSLPSPRAWRERAMCSPWMCIYKTNPCTTRPRPCLITAPIFSWMHRDS